MSNPGAAPANVVATAIVEERQRLLRELHDRALQLLTSARMRLDACQNHWPLEPAELQSEMAAIQMNLDRAITEIRNILAENQDGEPMQAGSLEGRLRDELTIFSARSGVRIDLYCAIDSRDLPTAVERELYFTLREGVLNAVRHARASEIHVSLGRGPGGYRALLSDNGIGFIPAASEGGNHYGLKGMRERVAKLGGTLDIESAPGAGTRLTIAIPHPSN